MNIAPVKDAPEESSGRKPLRLWPGVVAVALQWLSSFVVPIIFPEAGLVSVFGELAGALIFVIWWVFFSRASWTERPGAVVLMILALIATFRFLHPSIATGAQGLLFLVLAIPVLSMAFVGWALITRHFPDRTRWATMAITIVAACGAWTLLKTGGFTGSFHNDLQWRWAKNPEERLLARTANEPMASAPAPAPVNTGADWPGFRGPNRDGILRGVRIETDWSRSPPVLLWRRPVGPGWSSFAVRGNLAYTQEQRGEDEFVTCYNLTTGEPVWQHRDPVRFWESNGGAGPRATPTLHNRRVYSFGGTGILNALDAGNGSVTWSRNVAADTETKVPGWGFASSPLRVGDLVIVAASGKLVAYETATGKPRWSGPSHGGSYSSPHEFTIDGTVQVLLLNGAGLTSLSATNGAVLWEYKWPGVTIVQPALLADRDLLVSNGDNGGLGTRRLAITHGPDGWTVQERWRSTLFRPYFNDLVVHKSHAYGFSGSGLVCIKLEDGARKWKGGRYGNGQLILLADQDILLVVSEQGQLALVAATPEEFKEIARYPAIKGKTWNHPVLAGEVLLVRNAEEMAAFRLHGAGGLRKVFK